MSDDTSSRHESYMRRSIELAVRALETSDAPVGAIVVQGGTVIGEGIESVRAHGDVTAHAEILAVRAACERVASLDLSGATLYTSVEPCPMCAYAIRLARIGTVVCGARAPTRSTACSGWHILTSPDALPARPVSSVIRDVLAAECAALGR